jgi:hypothetical protein
MLNELERRRKKSSFESSGFSGEKAEVFPR